MTSSLEEQVVVVLGGTSGIGRALTLGLAARGADVVATGRRREQVQEVADQVRRYGRRTLSMCADVTDRGSLERLRDAVMAQFGHVDVLLNCAGKIKRGPTLDFPESEWSDILETNLTGTLRGCQVFGRSMLDRGYGRIVNVASLTSFVALSEVAAYGASKAGMVALTRSLAVEWGDKGVCVNAIAPGIFRTSLNSELLDGTPRGREFLMRTPMKRFGDVDEIVGAAAFLASPAASFVTGQVVVVDGGFLASGVNQ